MKAGLDEGTPMRNPSTEVEKFYSAGPAGIPSQVAFIKPPAGRSLDNDRAKGCIRSLENAYSLDGGLAVLYGNIAEDGCVVKTAGVDSSILVFEAPPMWWKKPGCKQSIIYSKIKVKAGDVVVVRYEKVHVAARHAGNALPHILPLNRKDSAKACALLTDGRFSGGTSGLSIGHVSPEGAGGAIGLIRNSDRIKSISQIAPLMYNQR